MASVIVPGTGAFRSVLDSLKTVAALLRKADKIAEYQTILSAQDQLIELQTQVYDLQERLRESERQLKLLQEDQVSAAGRMVWKDLLWLQGDDDPYCLHCWDSRKRLFHVMATNMKGDWPGCRCPECGSQTVRRPAQSYWQTTAGSKTQSA